jgi:hypothetical protein
MIISIGCYNFIAAGRNCFLLRIDTEMNMMIKETDEQNQTNKEAQVKLTVYSND